MAQISLKAARVNANLTQAKAAELLNVSTNTVKNWESGKTYPKQPQIMKLCELYKITYDDIFFDN